MDEVLINRVVRLVELKRDKELDTPFLLGAYSSLRAAEDLGYTHDAFIRLPPSQQSEVMSGLVDGGVLAKLVTEEGHRLTEVEKTWLAGYFFNNALFRLAALAEIRLHVLRNHTDPLHKEKDCTFYGDLKWFEQAKPKDMRTLDWLRKTVNYFKHKQEPEDNYDPSKPKVRTIKDGALALAGVLTVMEDLARAKGWMKN